MVVFPTQCKGCPLERVCIGCPMTKEFLTKHHLN